jgi:hypothetical protein
LANVPAKAGESKERIIGDQQQGNVGRLVVAGVLAIDEPKLGNPSPVHG